MNEYAIKDGQILALRRLVGSYAPDDKAKLWLVEKLTGHAVERFEDLTLDDWQKVRNEAYLNWKNDDWSVSAAFAMKLAKLRGQYTEEHLGQLRLF